MRQKQRRETSSHSASRHRRAKPSPDRLKAEEVGLEQGIERIVSIVSRIQERPVFIAVYGMPDSGKSFLIERLVDRFEENNLIASGDSEGPTEVTFDMLRRYHYYYGDVLVFHCEWDRTKPEVDPWRHPEDPNILAENVLARKVNLNIGIYNPKLEEKPTGNYDFIITNPDSVKNHKKEAQEEAV